MTAAWMENLELLAEAPDGIKKLRELILELAVRGKLVPQNPSDEPASELLKRIAAEKARLVAEGNIKKQKPPAEISEDDKPFELPEGWEWVRLPDIYYPVSVSGNKMLSSQISDEGCFPVVDQGKRFIAGYTSDESLLINLPGPVVVFGDHTTERKYIDFDFVAGADGVKILRPVLMDEKFFWWQLVGLRLEERGYARHFKILNEALFALPPNREQGVIAAKVDELMALCDRLEARQADAQHAHARLVQALLDSLTQARDAEEFQAAWERVAGEFETGFATDAAVDALKLAVCQLGVSGRLVKPVDETANTMTLVAALTDHWQKRSPRRAALAEVPQANQRHPVPNNWIWLYFGFVAETRLGKMLDAAKNTGTHKPYLRNTNVQWDRFELEDLKELRLEDTELDEYAIKAGDLLICEGGEPGRCAVWRDATREIYFQKALHRARPLCGVSADFLKICLSVDAATGVLGNFFTGATIKHLTGEKLERYAVPVPPPEEQHRIVAKVTELLALCDQLKAGIVAARAKQAQLAEALVKQAVATAAG